MSEKVIEERVFASDEGAGNFKIPYIVTPPVNLKEGEKLPTLTDQSEAALGVHFANLKKSELNHGGTAVIFGTYDNLHAGHRTMLRTAASISDELYVGMEGQAAALERKKNKHPIMSDEERVKAMVDLGITTPDKIFIRKNALDDFKALEAMGKNITTLVVGESQRDNPEIIATMEYALSKGIQVVAITRLKSLNGPDISSSALHKSGAAKVSTPQP